MPLVSISSQESDWQKCKPRGQQESWEIPCAHNSILGYGFMMREDERQGCCVWVSFPVLFPSWLAPLNNPAVWFAGILMGLGGYEYIGSWDFSNFRCLFGYVLTVWPWFLSASLFLYLWHLCSSTYATILMTLQWEQKCLAEFEHSDRKPLWSFLRVSYPSLPALGCCVTSSVLVCWQKALVLTFSCLTHSGPPF